MSENHLITIENCCVQDQYKVHLPRIDWNMELGEAWLVIGPNGGGKAEFVRGLAGQLEFAPNSVPSAEPCFDSAKSVPLYSSVFTGSTVIVSLEEAAALIEEDGSVMKVRFLTTKILDVPADSTFAKCWAVPAKRMRRFHLLRHGLSRCHKLNSAEWKKFLIAGCAICLLVKSAGHFCAGHFFPAASCLSLVTRLRD